ncbi:hypothetical protein AAFN86_07275 [Roseomonas sp. CAU 1739]|uniref:hypothetical protein n=1 Tax=Roseomonas sp. CAU 1739 TaxID=3140364 RepID=UPI00325B54FA
MAAAAETSIEVLDLALRAGFPVVAMRQAEHAMLAQREGPPDVAGAVTLALQDACGDQSPSAAVQRTAHAIAEAVERHGAGFPPGAEPAYHDRHHQAEATRAMGWLAGAARRRGLLDTHQAALAVAAMAAHDLLHDGRVHEERGKLERASADAAATIAAAQDLPAQDIALLRRMVLATTWPWAEHEAPDLACHLAREADLFGSSLPVLGPHLSRLLARELSMAGQASADSVASHAARVALLKLMPPATVPAQALGLDQVRAAQLEAYAGVARRLGLDEASEEAAAAALDTMDSADAEALLAWADTQA